MQRRLALAATLVHEPELLYLDEPTAGVDPILRDRFWTHFRTLRDLGATVIVPTQYIGEAVSCDLVAVMSAGQIITVQPPTALSRFAFGGDPLLVPFNQGWASHADIQRLLGLPFVRSVERVEDGLAVAVDDRDAGITALEEHARDSGLTVPAITPYEPTMDAIFIKIVEDHRAQASQLATAESAVA
jgi:ABC-2 type transport system ATP-binding protein